MISLLFSPLESKDKNGKQYHIRFIQWTISGFIKVYSTSDKYIINMMFILLNITEVGRSGPVTIKQKYSKTNFILKMFFFFSIENIFKSRDH